MHPPPSSVDPTSALSALMQLRGEYFRFVRQRMHHDADAEDVVQQALLTASLKLHTLKDLTALRAWFFRLLRRAVYDHRVASAKRASGVAELAREMGDAAPEDAAVCGCSLGLLRELRPEYAEVLQRVDIDEQSIADAAQQLSLSPNNTKVRLHRARKALKLSLKACCGAETLRSLHACACDSKSGSV